MEEIVETKKTKMSIARALKEKERIGKKLLEARNELKEFNCIDRKEHPDVNQQEIFDRVQALEPKYLKIRQTIATANMGITDQLTEMLIIRARITFYTVLDCRTSETVNKFLPGRPGMRDCEQTRVEYDTFIDRKKRSEILEQLQSASTNCRTRSTSSMRPIWSRWRSSISGWLKREQGREGRNPGGRQVAAKSRVM